MASRYSGLIGRWHLTKERLKERWADVQEEGGVAAAAKSQVATAAEAAVRKINHGDESYDHLFRRKSRWELVRVSAAVMGIEFAYAAETAFVSPTLLKIGVRHEHMTMIWCLSPLIGFFLTPIMGSLSDHCNSRLGRRRPFIIMLSIGVVLGLILVPNGKWLGKQFGDLYEGENAPALATAADANMDWADEDVEGPGGRLYAIRTDEDGDDGDEDEVDDGGGGGGEEEDEEDQGEDGDEINIEEYDNSTLPVASALTLEKSRSGGGKKKALKSAKANKKSSRSHPWGVFFTVLGTVLLDFDADSCQSPSRAYLLDVTLPDDHATGLSTFTIMAGLGGSLGYAMGGINWGGLDRLFGGHVRLVFSLVLVIFVVCVISTLTSFAEMPLDILTASRNQYLAKRRRSSQYIRSLSERGRSMDSHTYGSFEANEMDPVWDPRPQHKPPTVPEEEQQAEAQQEEQQQQPATNHNPFKQRPQSLKVDPSPAAAQTKSKPVVPVPVSHGHGGGHGLDEADEAGGAKMDSVTQYLWTIIYMPNSLRVLCLTNLFCWMSLVCYSLYFTDFVGEAVFGGDPQAPLNTRRRQLYDEGVQFGCWGMAMYSFSCSCYSFIIESLVKRFKAKPVYVGGQLVYSVGMVLMALTRTKWGVLLFSWSAGVMYSTLFTMPYLLVAHYHEHNMYSQHESTKSAGSRQQRGIGTDVAIVSCMVFLAQFILSLSMGSIIKAFESTVAVVVAAAVLSFCGAVTANFVTYLQL